MSTHDPAQPGWWQRNWKWCVPVLGALLLVLFAAFVFGIVALVFGAIKSSGPYQHAITRAQSDPAVIAALGEPIHAGWFVQGNISTSGASGEADLAIGHFPEAVASIAADGAQAAPGRPGRLYVLDANGQPTAQAVRLGVSDGATTELLVSEQSPQAGTLAEGAMVVTGVSVNTGPARTNGPRMSF